MKLRNLVVALALANVLAACADGPQRKEDGCDKEYAGTLMHCAVPKKEPKTDCVPVIKDGRQVACMDRWELQRIFDSVSRDQMRTHDR